ncbi:hypothetical protein [Streptomyces sp. NPDC055060]
MHHTEPPGILAPHIPADTYRRAEATGVPVVIVVQSTAQRPGIPWKKITVPLAIAGAAALGLWGLIAAFLALIDYGTHVATTVAGAAGPIGIGGITLKFARHKGQ